MGRTNKTTRAGPSVDDLMTYAKTGDKQAWEAPVVRYAPLIWSICRRHLLVGAGDVGQKVWLQLVSQLDKIRDPAALPGWLATTTRRECGRVQRAARGPQAAGYVPDAETTTNSRRRTIPTPRLLPQTIHLCIHCQHNPAGFWVSRNSDQMVRRPWCLSCCQDLDPACHHIRPFDLRYHR